MTDWLLPFLCAFGAGVLSAWGVGGGTLLLLMMTLLLGVDQRTAQGVNLLFFLPTAASALLCHWRAGQLDLPTVKGAAPWAAAAAAPTGLPAAWAAFPSWAAPWQCPTAAVRPAVGAAARWGADR